MAGRQLSESVYAVCSSVLGTFSTSVSPTPLAVDGRSAAARCLSSTSARASRSVSKRSAYVRSVRLGSSWPSILASASTFPPADTARLAAVCLRSFGVTVGKSLQGIAGNVEHAGSPMRNPERAAFRRRKDQIISALADHLLAEFIREERRKGTERRSWSFGGFQSRRPSASATASVICSRRRSMSTDPTVSAAISPKPQARVRQEADDQAVDFTGGRGELLDLLVGEVRP